MNRSDLCVLACNGLSGRDLERLIDDGGVRGLIIKVKLLSVRTDELAAKVSSVTEGYDTARPAEASNVVPFSRMSP